VSTATRHTKPSEHVSATGLRRPYLRGWSHALAVAPAVAATIVLVVLARDDRGRQLGLLVYGLTSVLLFSISAVYHIGTWSPSTRAALRRLDHTNIFLLIAGTYTPVTVTVLDGAWRISILAAVWALALLGILLTVVAMHRVPRSALTLCYLAQGWVALVALPKIGGAVGWGGLAFLLGGGLLYSLGACTYAVQRPRLWPRFFGYHEVFHLLVIAANTVFFLFMLLRIVPYGHG
jgi:hemolysin III